MANLMELSRRYNILYSLWAIIENYTNHWGKTGWLNKIAEKQMNKISQAKYNENIFFLPE